MGALKFVCNFLKNLRLKYTPNILNDSASNYTIEDVAQCSYITKAIYTFSSARNINFHSPKPKKLKLISSELSEINQLTEALELTKSGRIIFYKPALNPAADYVNSTHICNFLNINL
jgi:hypothetical protein